MRGDAYSWSKNAIVAHRAREVKSPLFSRGHGKGD